MPIHLFYEAEFSAAESMFASHELETVDAHAGKTAGLVLAGVVGVAGGLATIRRQRKSIVGLLDDVSSDSLAMLDE